MMRILNIALLAVLIGIATWTYSVKHEAQDRLAEIRALEDKIATERNSIDLLKADWAFLSDPQRLKVLADRYQEDLGLQTTRPEQIATFDELPGPPPEPVRDALTDIIAGDATDLLTTGSVGGGQ